MNNTGQYNRRITHIANGEATNTPLGIVYGEPVITDVWCKARQLSMRQKFNYGLESGIVTMEFRFKYLTALNFKSEDRFIYNGDNFIVSSLENVNDSDQEIAIIATKDTSKNV